MTLISHQKLPLQFDPRRLSKDLALIEPDEWQLHFRDIHYTGGWAAVPLVAAGGSRDVQTHTGADFRPTPVLERCAYFQEVISRFMCPLRRVRLLRLDAQSSIKKHVDPLYGDASWVRIHVPIETNDLCKFYSAGNLVHMAAGETWYLDTGQPHQVVNRGASRRVHLVLDCDCNSFINDLFGVDIVEHRLQHLNYYVRLERRYGWLDKVRSVRARAVRVIARAERP